MKAGAKRKPTIIKVLNGTDRKDRDQDVDDSRLVTAISIPKPPTHFRAIHKAVWTEWCEQLVEAGTLTLEVKNLLVSYAWAMGEIQIQQKAGKETKAALMTEIRRTGEYLSSKIIAKPIGSDHGGNSGFSKFKK